MIFVLSVMPCRYRSGQLLDLRNRTRYDGATLERPSLFIRSATREDSGSYSCVLENELGPSLIPAGSAELSVHFKPEVVIKMSPEMPVSEVDQKNVTLSCELISGYPAKLDVVKWYMNGEMLKKLPECYEDLQYDVIGVDDSISTSNRCHIDPSKLLLANVTRLFHGNFSCEGANDAGWSDRSLETELRVHCKDRSGAE